MFSMIYIQYAQLSLSKNRHTAQYQPIVMIFHIWLLITTLYLQEKELVIHPVLVC